MESHSILLHVGKHIALTTGEEEIFLSILKPRTIKKKQFLLHENEVCQFSAFVTIGCLRGYTVDNNGFEHILQFAPSDWWISDMYSLISGQPGRLNIDALENTSLLLLYRTDQHKLFTLIPKFERYFRILVENSLVASRQRVMDNMELTAIKRYHKFCTVYPSLIHTLPQKLIAAYLGITPEFLSKIKSESPK